MSECVRGFVQRIIVKNRYRAGLSGCFFWYRPTRVVLDQRPLNGCVCVCISTAVPLYGHGGRGSNMGARSPKVKIFCFPCSNRHGSGGEICHVEIIVTGGFDKTNKPYK